MVKTDRVLAELPAKVDVLLVDDGREVEKADVEVLDEASRFENAVQSGLQRLCKLVMLHTDGRELFVRDDHTTHHHDPRGHGREFVFQARKFFSGIHGFDEKRLEFLAGTLPFSQREETPPRVPGLRLFLVLLLLCPSFSSLWATFRFLKKQDTPCH